MPRTRKKEKLDLWLEAIENDEPIDEVEDVEIEEKCNDDYIEECDDKGADDEDSIVSMNESDMAVQLERRHFEFLVNLFASLLNIPSLKINTLDDPKAKDIIDLITIELAPTNRGFKRDKFLQRLRQRFNEYKTGQDDGEDVIDDELETEE